MATGKRVLSVGDHVAIREVVGSVLEDEGFEAWGAANGAEGVHWIY
jgi:CheY-like chemotaxis protein